MGGENNEEKRGTSVCRGATPTPATRPPPRVTFRLVVVPLWGPGQSPVLPFACCVGSLLSVGRCGRCSCWCRFRVRAVVGVPGLCWMWRGVPFARQRRPIIGVLRMCWLLPGSFDCFCCPHTSVHRPSIACLAVPGRWRHPLSAPSCSPLPRGVYMRFPPQPSPKLGPPTPSLADEAKRERESVQDTDRRVQKSSERQQRRRGAGLGGDREGGLRLPPRSRAPPNRAGGRGHGVWGCGAWGW